MHAAYTLWDRKTAPFYFCNNFVKPHCMLIIYWQACRYWRKSATKLQQMGVLMWPTLWNVTCPSVIITTAHRRCLASLAVSDKRRHWSTIDQWRHCFNACLKAKNKHWEHLLWCVSFSAIFMTFKVYTLLVIWTSWLTFRFTRYRVRTAIRRGGQFCYSFVADLLQYLSAKNYQNTVRFDKVIANIKRCNFFLPHSVWRKRKWRDG